MKRRLFLSALPSAAMWPLTAAAQPKTAVVGILEVGDPGPMVGLLRQGLRDRGYVEGQNIRLEIRTPDASRTLRELAEELVRLNVDVIVAKFTPAVRAAKNATATIPIVMAPAGAPVETGLIAALARPGGNVTGLSGTAAEIGGKRIEVIREILPGVSRLGVLANTADPFTKPFLDEMQSAGASVGVQVRPFMVSGSGEFAAAFSAMRDEGVGGVILQPSLTVNTAADMALAHRLPSFGVFRSTVEAGALMSYSARLEDLYREAAVYVDRILKGAKPADLPVQQPTRFELVINLKTAKALSLTVPPALLARADEVIE